MLSTLSGLLLTRNLLDLTHDAKHIAPKNLFQILLAITAPREFSDQCGKLRSVFHSARRRIDARR